jgi:hypothetical protein
MERNIEVSTRVPIGLEECRRAFAADALTLVGDPVDGGDGAVRVELHTDPGLRQVVLCRVGRPRASSHEVRIHVRWRAISRERWLPAFDGELIVTDIGPGGGSTLTLRGFYTVPLGALGGFGDGLIGHRIARKTLTTLLADVAARVDERVAA